MYRNNLNRIRIFEKRKHYSEIFHKIGKNAKLLWNVVNGLLKKCHHKVNTTELLYKNSVLNDSSEICEAFNKHFSSIGKKTQSTISNDSETTGGLDCIKMVTYNRTLSFCKVSEQHLCKIISNTKPKTSSGSDNNNNNNNNNNNKFFSTLLDGTIHVHSFEVTCVLTFVREKKKGRSISQQ